MNRLLMLTTVFSTTISAFAFANEPALTGLPGVKPQTPIVSAPPPAPEPDNQQGGTWKNFRVGNTDVSVSGSITVDVGNGNSRISRR